MNETKLLLSPDPNNPKAKPDFLATVEPIKLPHSKSITTDDFNLPFELTFDGYTREAWSVYNSSVASQWKYCYLHSTDGRNRLPGFLKYLRDRKKAAVAKFEPTDVSIGQEGKAVLVVPFDQPAIEQVPEGVADKNQLLFVMYLRDENVLHKKNGNGQQQQKQQTASNGQSQKIQPKLTTQQKPIQKPNNPPMMKPIQISKKGGGLLGNLLVSKQRTENHLSTVRGPTRSTTTDPLDLSATITGAAFVISNFRNKISNELESFASDSTKNITQVNISLSALVKEVPLNERDKVTMDILKYIVYEQVEETNDGWIAAKEPGGFMDECTIVVYKGEECCPREVLEDLNRGELPEEVKGHARHLAEAQSKKNGKGGMLKEEEIMKQQQGSYNDVTVLNTNKRDRRTLEQIQRDLETETEEAKRRRFD
jgi:hypothetical protein